MENIEGRQQTQLRKGKLAELLIAGLCWFNYWYSVQEWAELTKSRDLYLDLWNNHLQVLESVGQFTYWTQGKIVWKITLNFSYEHFLNR